MGGDHKCPLCAATFTRPQHVGRHLRAHTGDRPYECKECPLRFARSDLLSRHVNKTHPKVTASAADKNDSKKPRRKSSTVSQHSLPVVQQQQQQQHTNTLPTPSPQRAPVPLLPAATVPPPHEPTAFQAQRMYPNHPLLQQNAGSWASTAFDLGSSQFNAPLDSHMVGDNASLGHVGIPHGISFLQSPLTSTAMRMSSSDQGDNALTISPAGFATSLPSTFQSPPRPTADLESSCIKKRACDQCNHSKVRCDFADPCARCSHRSVSCTYSKPARSRTTVPAVERQPAAPPYASFQPHRGSTVIGGFPERRNSAPQTEPCSFLTSDALLHPDIGGGFRNSGIDPNWATGVAAGLHVTTDMSASSMLQRSPMNMSMAVTPTLTHSTSPTASECTDRRGSTNSNLQSSWGISGSEYNMNVQPSKEPMVQSSLANPGQTLWPGFDARVGSPNSSVLVSEDDDTPPTTETDKQRRRSSAGKWENAFNQMKLDDPGLMLDVNGQLQFPFQPQRPSGTERPGMLSRQATNQDVNFWKLFLEPAALQTPEAKYDMDPTVAVETPRALNKSSSMPDLTTPPSATADSQAFPQLHQQVAPSNDASRVHSEDEAMGRWKDHIQQRQASFSIHLSPHRNARIRTQAIPNASFASSMGNRPVRPLPSALISTAAALDQTLAPERMPSFGTPPTDPATPMAPAGHGQLGHPGVTPKARTATKLQQHFERPVNKRQASQTLLPEVHKRIPCPMGDSACESPPRHFTSIMIPTAGVPQG